MVKLLGGSITEARGIIEEIDGSRRTKSGTRNRQIRVTDQSPRGFMITYKQKKGVWSVGGSWNAMRLENKTLCNCSLNIWKQDGEGAFSPRKFCKCLFVRGTISFCKGNCKFLPVGESKMECINATQWIMLKRNYFVFSGVSFAVRMCLNSWTYVLVECSSVSCLIFSTVSNYCRYKMIGYLVI